MDNIPNVALTTVIKAAPDIFLDVYNTCLTERTYPAEQQAAGLPFILSPIVHAGYTGKNVGKIIFNRIEAAVGHLLADNQYGFRKGRSTLDVVNQVIGEGKEAISRVRWERGSKKYCLMAALDAKNAFNVPEQDD